MRRARFVLPAICTLAARRAEQTRLARSARGYGALVG